MRVDTHISGSRCVIWRTSEHYIDVRHTQDPTYDIAECVRSGQVYRREHVYVADGAPAHVAQLIREELLC
jgi:hypothetical protein